MQMLSVASYEAIVKYLLDKSNQGASTKSSPSLNPREELGKSSSQKRKMLFDIVEH
jgi:hypothetical protein